VIVEGHVIGRLDGFTFAPDAAEAGSDAKALQATAQKALAGEIDTRAEKLAAAPDDQFVLASDGTLRWTGDAVAKLMAAEDALHPRLRIIADDRLNGAAREAVQTRLDLWLKTHIEKLLGPLFELSKAEDITGIARGIAFQLIEALGVLERARIQSEMKDLDQPSRASLRKYGVRFGAYHIYLPALLKPAARALASLLWAQKQDNVDMSALSGAQHLASSGRTSFPIDKTLDRDAYRILGYKQCGERAVRVDILERLADLIRPALAWRESSPGEKPAGAFDGRGFVVTQAMTSLTGSAGEDFASILRALGYRMDRRPPLPPKPVEVVETAAAEAAVVEASDVEAPVVEAAGVEATSSEQGAPSQAAPSEAVTEDAAAPSVAEDTAVAEDTTATDETVVAEDIAVAEDTPPISSVSLLPDVAFAPASHEAPAEAQPEAAAPAEASAETTEPQATEAPQEQIVAEPPVETVAGEAAAPADPAAATEKAAPEAAVTPELVEVWRPGGRSEERRPRHDRNRHRHQGHQEGAQPAAAAGETAEGEKREPHHRRGRRGRHQDFRVPRSDAPGAAAPAAAVAATDGAPAPEAREDRGPRRERFEGKGRDR
jgi:ATP-dependent RNA helicase SUPV3L1/SUV3